MKTPDEQLLHFAQIQALRDEELNKAKKKISEVPKCSPTFQPVVVKSSR